MKKQNLRPESTIQRCCVTRCHGIQNTYRLLRCLDTEHGTDIYSLFLTTQIKDLVDEEFIFDLARTEAKATAFLEQMLKMQVTACTLADIASDLLAEGFHKNDN